MTDKTWDETCDELCESAEKLALNIRKTNTTGNMPLARLGLRLESAVQEYKRDKEQAEKETGNG